MILKACGSCGGSGGVGGGGGGDGGGGRTCTTRVRPCESIIVVWL